MTDSPRLGLSAESYFSRLLEQARRAGEAGNYAIAAGLAVHGQFGEFFLTAANTLIGDRDPVGHAELNTIRSAQRLAAVGADHSALVEDALNSGRLTFRECQPADRKTVLYTTLEPCPMCTVAILNAGIDRVVIAAPDPLAGTLHADRLGTLPPIWHRLARRLDVVWAQSTDPVDTDSYVPETLHGELIETFLRSRDEIDADLEMSGVLDTGRLEQILAEHLGARS
jgi:tRNA(Arg) A34 adenosine deaminase TadA